MKHKGSCHCGNVAFEVEGDVDGALSCNCSICTKKAWLLWFVPRDNLTLHGPEDSVRTYTFNKHAIKHHFCPNCGIHPFGEGSDPQGNPVAVINLRCLEDIDISAIPIQEFDGRSL